LLPDSFPLNVDLPKLIIDQLSPTARVQIVEAEIVDQTFEPFLVQAFEAAIASLDQSRVQEGTT
jgi:hypothetical protein